MTLSCYTYFNEISFFVFILRPGSVVVEYRVSWKPKDNETDSDMKWVEKSIGEYLSDNGGYMMNQLVDIQAVQTNVVKDQCLKNSMK